MKRLVIILVLLVSCRLSHSQNKPTLELNNQTLVELSALKKDPFSASVYSLLYSGAGQFYAGNYSLGSLLFLGETLYHLFNIGMRYKMLNEYGESVSFSQLQSTDQIVLGTVFFSFLFIKVYSIYEANISVRKYNKQIDERLNRFDLSYIPGDIKASYHIRF